MYDCIICKSSKILLSDPKTGGWQTIYQAGKNDENQIVNTHKLIDDQTWEQSMVKLRESSLTSIRYFSDYHFSKDATFYHNLKNSQEAPVEIFLQEYLIGALKPYMHELKISTRNMDTGIKS